MKGLISVSEKMISPNNKIITIQRVKYFLKDFIYKFN